MRIAYHKTGSSLTPAALDAWIAAKIAAWPTIDSAGLLISVGDPKHPFRWESDTVADDRITLGGKSFSKIRYTARNVEIEFPPLSENEAATWRTFYAATKGFRLPFIVEHPILRTVIALVGGQPFPFSLTNKGLYSGSVNWRQYL